MITNFPCLEAHSCIHSRKPVSESQGKWDRLQDKCRTLSYTGAHQVTSEEACLKTSIQDGSEGLLILYSS